MKKTKRNGATGIAVRNLFTVMAALLLVFGFNACSNGGGGGGPAGEPGGTKDSKYFRPGTTEYYEVGDEVTSDDGVSGKIFYDSFKDPDIMDYFTLYRDADDKVGVKARYLVVHPDRDETTYRWASQEFIGPPPPVPRPLLSIDGTGTAVGTGKKNTALILKLDPNAPPAKKCRDYGAEWFLPSVDEVVKLTNLPENDLLWAGGYWSSSQFDMVKAWAGRTEAADPDDFRQAFEKYLSFRVFAIRAF